jgi:hypothetical protein
MWEGLCWLKHKTQELNRNKKDLPVVVADGADKYALVVAFIQAEWSNQSVLHTTHEECEKGAVLIEARHIYGLNRNKNQTKQQISGLPRSSHLLFLFQIAGLKIRIKSIVLHQSSVGPSWSSASIVHILL